MSLSIDYLLQLPSYNNSNTVWLFSLFSRTCGHDAVLSVHQWAWSTTKMVFVELSNILLWRVIQFKEEKKIIRPSNIFFIFWHVYSFLQSAYQNNRWYFPVALSRHLTLDIWCTCALPLPENSRSWTGKKTHSPKNHLPILNFSIFS